MMNNPIPTHVQELVDYADEQQSLALNDRREAYAEAIDALKHEIACKVFAGQSAHEAEEQYMLLIRLEDELVKY